MAIFTVCITQENVDYKPIHEANTLTLKSVPSFNFSFVIGVVLVLENVLSTRKMNPFYQQYLDDL